MRKIYTLSAMLTLAIFQTALAQTNTFPSTGSAGIGTITPSASSILELKSTTQGLLIPRMTLAQRDAIVGPATGLMIYQTSNTPGFYYYDGGKWMAVSPKGVNKSLSNLTPTAINQSLIPGITNSIDLGSPSILWKNAYFSGDVSINGITVGVGGGSIKNAPLPLLTAYCTAMGSSALYNNRGDGNTANGYFSSFSTTFGRYNNAAGYQSLYSNSTGSFNTVNGSLALYSNTEGYSNVAIGHSALYSNATSSNLVAVGDSALYMNTGPYNMAAAKRFTIIQPVMETPLTVLKHFGGTTAGVTTPQMELAHSFTIPVDPVTPQTDLIPLLVTFQDLITRAWDT